jgi:uncharacterized membrane protein YkvA (DUF1232 family)
MFNSLKSFIFNKFKPINFYKKLLNDPKTRVFTIIFTLLYLINPFDIIPDFIPIFGWIDDLALLTILIETLLASRKSQKGETVEAKEVKSK